MWVMGTIPSQPNDECISETHVYINGLEKNMVNNHKCYSWYLWNVKHSVYCNTISKVLSTPHTPFPRAFEPKNHINTIHN